MKMPIWISIAGTILLASCGNDSGKPAQTTNAASEGSLVTAPVDYLGAIAKGEQQAVKTVDVASLNKAIQLFQVDLDRYPTNLAELAALKYIPRIPPTPFGTKLDYDPTSGQVKVVKQQQQ